MPFENLSGWHEESAGGRWSGRGRGRGGGVRWLGEGLGEAREGRAGVSPGVLSGGAASVMVRLTGGKRGDSSSQHTCVPGAVLGYPPCTDERRVGPARRCCREQVHTHTGHMTRPCRCRDRHGNEEACVQSGAVSGICQVSLTILSSCLSRFKDSFMDGVLNFR